MANLPSCCKLFLQVPSHHHEQVFGAAKEAGMKKYMIEREIRGVGALEGESLRGVASKSNQVLSDLGPSIQWQESFVTADKTFCVYLAEDEAIVRKHAEISGFPATKITEIGKTIDPTAVK
jgi:hypothetical protein